MTLPRYRELPPADGGTRSAWHLFGPDDGAGLINLLTPDRVAEAARCIVTGDTFALTARAGLIDPPLFARGGARRTTLELREETFFDDVHDNVYPQSGSQWDSLAHVAFRADEFYNGATAEDIRAGRRNGIEHWGSRGIAGRGVLLDLTSAVQGRDPSQSQALTVADLEAARERSGVEYRTGDILFLRTGFLEHHIAQPDGHRKRQAVRSTLTAAGIEHSEAMAEYLWNAHVCAVVADNPAVEVWPPDERPEAWPFGFLHHVLIGQFGMALGELWWLKDLAEACARYDRYEFFIASAPLDAVGGIGSPANAVAIL